MVITRDSHKTKSEIVFEIIDPLYEYQIWNYNFNVDQIMTAIL